MKEGLTLSKIDQALAKIKPMPVVALVDDDRASLDLLERALHDEKFAIHRFSCAEELLERLDEIRPDVVVMEAILPGISGLSVLDVLRPKRIEEMLPVLIVSKKDDIRAKTLAFRRGAWDYVTKPFQPEEVAERVRSLVRAKLLREMLEMSSISDPLTSLYNRRFLESWLGIEIHRLKRRGGELSCLLLDLDGFKEINEKNGERFGDFLLREFATVTSKTTRSSDVMGRVGADRFLLLLPATPKEKALVVGRRIRQRVSEQSFEQGGKKAHPTFCMGVIGCQAPEPPLPSMILEKAEEALEKAKSVGLNQTAVIGID